MDNFLKFKPEFHELLIEKIKTSTIRLHSNLKKGDHFKVITNRKRGAVKYEFEVLKVNRIRFDEINREIALKEGYCHEDLLKRDLYNIYSDLKESTLLYQIEFKLFQSSVKDVKDFFKRVSEDERTVLNVDKSISEDKDTVTIFVLFDDNTQVIEDFKNTSGFFKEYLFLRRRALGIGV